MRSVESDIGYQQKKVFSSLKFLGLVGGKKGSAIPIIIPSCIGKLKKLQTLWTKASRAYTTPREISELHGLRFLHFNYSRSLNIGSH